MDVKGILFSALLVCAIILTARAESPQRIVVLANSIDGSLADGLYGFLGDKGMEVVRVNASEFGKYRSEKFIVILGGQNAPDGVGDVVKKLLSLEEQESLVSSNTSRRMFVKANVWARGQVVWVFAGYDRQQTRMACIKYMNQITVYATTPSTTAVTSTSTTTLSTAAADIKSCSDYCKSIGYDGGICRLNPGQCHLKGKNEFHKMRGDKYCEKRMEDSCCCVVE